MTLDTNAFGRALKKIGYDFYSGVPCSFLKDLINYAINESNFIMSNNEGDAVATCSGAYLSGRKAVVLMQNSGLTNAVSPLTSLNYCFQLPVLGFVSLRGETGLNDEPQHELMGKITERLLELMEIQWEYLSPDVAIATEQLARADDFINKGKTFFFVVKKNTLSKVALKVRPEKVNLNQFLSEKCEKPVNLPTRGRALEVIHAIRGENTVVLATTGKTGRELYEVEDYPGNLYMVGSMGCISSLGLGLALNSKKNVIAVDGDGALLMRLGNLATNGFYGPKNLLHILLDNGSHDSTGGQFTVSDNVCFTRIAASCGYTKSVLINSLEELHTRISEWKSKPELTFLHMFVKPGSKEDLGRPKIKPAEVKNRLTRFLNE